VHAELLESALKLACEGTGATPPTQTDLRRSISTSYYAAFHFILKQCADLLADDTDGTDIHRAWYQVYRSIDHGWIERASRKATDQTLCFPQAISDFSASFINWKESRHDADYNPDELFVASQALAIFGEVETAIQAFEQVDIKHRRAFAILVACGKRR